MSAVSPRRSGSAAADFAQEAGVPIHTTLTDLFASQHLDGVMVYPQLAARRERPRLCGT